MRPPGRPSCAGRTPTRTRSALDYTIFKKTPPDVSMVTAPVFTYYGAKDTTVPYSQRDAWVAAYSSSSKITQRNYPDGVHDVQYRHWDQILLDVAGYGDYLVIAFTGKHQRDPAEPVAVVPGTRRHPRHAGVGRRQAPSTEPRRSRRSSGARRRAPVKRRRRRSVTAEARRELHRTPRPRGPEEPGVATGPAQRRRITARSRPACPAARGRRARSRWRWRAGCSRARSCAGTARAAKARWCRGWRTAGGRT